MKNETNFQIIKLDSCDGPTWLNFWACRYEDSDQDKRIYRHLIDHHRSLKADDFVSMGQWKDGATGRLGRWKPNVASVAYPIWIQISQELPVLPPEKDIADFLTHWSDRTYEDKFTTRTVTKRFGLSRASTLLHFLSGGQYAIYDSRVEIALVRLFDCKPRYTVDYYIRVFNPLFKNLAKDCQTHHDLRRLDKALFSLGAVERKYWAKLEFSEGD